MKFQEVDLLYASLLNVYKEDVLELAQADINELRKSAQKDIQKANQMMKKIPAVGMEVL